MGMGLARALLFGAQGLGQQSELLQRERQAAAEQEQRLAQQGFFRRALKPDLPSTGNAVEPLRPRQAGPASTLGVLGDGGLVGTLSGMGRTLAMLPRREMDVTAAEVEPDEHGVFPDLVVRHPAPTGPAPERADPTELADALESATKTGAATAGKEHALNVEMNGGTYQFRPELSEQGRTLALQRALKEPGNRAAYTQWRNRHPDQNIGYDAVSDWQSVLAQDVGRETRTEVDPTRNRQYFDTVNRALGGNLSYIEGHDYKPMYDAYGRGEIGQANRTEFRVMFPPGGGGSSSEKDENGLPVRSRDERTQDANAEVETILMQRYNPNSSGQGEILSINDVRDIVRRHPGASVQQVVAHASRFLEHMKNPNRPYW